jgi:hypothetical protein
VLAAAAVLVLLAACTGSEPSPPGGRSASGSGTPPVTSSVAPSASTESRPPPFRFRLVGIHPSPTAKLRKPKARRIARHAAQRIRDRFDTLFRMAFVNPSAWRRGRYGLALRLFGGHVRPLAAKHLRILTLGLDAGRRFESVRYPRGQLKVNVLIAPNATPATASVHAVFQVHAVPKRGPVTLIVSDGHYFVRPGKHGWVIDAFEVRRKDHRAS